MKAIRLMFASLLLMGTLACGDSKKKGFVSTEESSKQSKSTIFSHCNLATGPQNLSVALGTVAYSRSTIELMFTGEPTEFNSNGAIIKFARSRAGSSPEVVSFLVEDLSTRRIVGPFNELTRLKLNQSLSGQDIRNVQIIIDSLPAEYQMLRISHQLTAANSTVSNLDVIVPELEVNPNKFAKRVASTLHSLHPLWSIRDQFNNDSDFQSRFSSGHRYCEN